MEKIDFNKSGLASAYDLYEKLDDEVKEQIQPLLKHIFRIHSGVSSDRDRFRYSLAKQNSFCDWLTKQLRDFVHEEALKQESYYR